MQVVSTSQCRVRRQANKRRYIYPYTHWSCPLRVIWRFHIFGANYSKQAVSKWQYRVMTHAWISWREQVNLYDFNDFLSWREENSWISWREQVDFSQINLLQRVVPSEVQNLERQRGQYQDSWVFRGLSKQNVAPKPRYLQQVWKEPCRVFGFVTFVTFLRLFHILGFVQKTIKKYVPCVKNLELSQNAKVWHCEISNITKCHKMSHAFKSLVKTLKLRLPLAFGFRLERL